MLSFSTLKETAIQIGAPATAVIVIILLLNLGWLPFDTELSRTRTFAEASVKKLDDNAAIMNRIAEQHLSQMITHDKQLDVLIGALREVCFNTAKTNERERACGALTRPVVH